MIKGATEGGVLGALAGAANVGNAGLFLVTGGMLNYDLSYSYTNGFGASIGGGLSLGEGLGVGFSLSYNEQTGFGASAGLQAGTSALSFNAGLSYSQAGGISGNAGVGIGIGQNTKTGSYAASLNLGVSYNQQDGFGGTAGLSSNNNKILPGMGGSITASEYAGLGMDMTTDQFGKYGNQAGGSGSSFSGLNGGLSWNERDGVTASFNVSGTNAFSYNESTGFSSNADFLSQWAMNNALAQGVAQTEEEKAAARQAEAAQNSGAQAIAAAGYEGTGRRNEDEGGESTNGAASDPVDQRIAQLKKELSEGISLAHDNGTMSDAGNPVLASAAKELSSKMAELKQLEGQKAASIKPGVQKDGSINVVGSRAPSLGERAASLFGSIADGAKGLWNKVTGGNSNNTNVILRPELLQEGGSYNFKPSREPNGVVKPLSDGAILPGKGFNVTSEFGLRSNPLNPTGPQTNHRGIDIGMPTGTPVAATSNGAVVFAGTKPNGSIEVHINHGNGLVSIFKHNSELLVQQGQNVERGQEISKSGNTGPSTGPHLHYQLELNRVPQNPATFNIRDWNY
ncbi:M23 family metallopeptidase [Leptospira noguchii]|uniref:Peptidase, M23 family n=1 Tax=Leptospira noguchii str. 2001034031 TaxID=1193053 RepID=M6YC76_9LEPT|nr:M23 family metallopeptidase [Leptospira noguchii]EMO87254.1 peptidase, M23 family [Leptospira noguchii str. 2001034031]